jgi:uncharacterized protein (TIGR00255 family)
MERKRMGKDKGDAPVRSMTGYGRGETKNDKYHFVVEIRSVNHRHLDPVIRLSRDLMAQEEIIRRRLQERVYRGRVEIYVNQEISGQRRKKVIVDEEMAASYCRALQQLQQSFAFAHTEITAEKLAVFPDVLILEKEELDEGLLVPLLQDALEKALDGFIRQREDEGSRLAGDICGRVQRLKDICTRLKTKSSLVTERYRQKLADRLHELFDGREYDGQRFFMEVALFAERSNIEEEIVRLESHLSAFSEAIEKEGEAIGRKLDFLLQEMYREVNTIVVKANDLEISHLVLDAKSEIEKIREQVQNIE